jgi:hypothetical protein
MGVGSRLASTAWDVLTLGVQPDKKGSKLSVAVEDRAIFAAWPRPPRAEWRAGDGASGG